MIFDLNTVILSSVAMAAIYAFYRYFSTSPRRLKGYIQQYEDIINDLKRDNKRLRAKLAYLEAGLPPSGLELGENVDIYTAISTLTSKLPKWARPLAEGIVDWAKKNPEKAQALLDQYLKKKESVSGEVL